MSGLNVLITNLKYSSRSGTGTYVRDLGLELVRQAHHPVIFTPVAGPIAVEAMAVGCAVVLCDQVGLGPLVTTKRSDELRAVNFGRRSLSNPITPENLLGEMARYDSGNAAEVSRRLRACAVLTETVETLAAFTGR